MIAYLLCDPLPATAVMEETDVDGIDYVEVTAVDGKPLADRDVEFYFGNFGKLAWCLQGDNQAAVILSFIDSSSYLMVFDFNHQLERRNLHLQPMKNGCIPVVLKKRRI